MAAALTGFKMYGNYAFYGALSRFAEIELGKIKEADGIADVPKKAESFAFGQACGKALAKELAGYSEEALFVSEAAVAKGIFMKLDPEAVAAYPPKALEDAVKTVFRALLKCAQIQTHTAKPGGEDINAWLAGYNNLLNGYEPCLSALTRLLLAPDAGKRQEMDAFFNRREPLVALSLGDAAPDAGLLDKAMSEKPSSEFGSILKSAVASLRGQ
jgi:hypothetical protein